MPLFWTFFILSNFDIKFFFRYIFRVSMDVHRLFTVVNCILSQKFVLSLSISKFFLSNFCFSVKFSIVNNCFFCEISIVFFSAKFILWSDFLRNFVVQLLFLSNFDCQLVFTLIFECFADYDVPISICNGPKNYNLRLKNIRKLTYKK